MAKLARRPATRFIKQNPDSRERRTIVYRFVSTIALLHLLSGCDQSPAPATPVEQEAASSVSASDPETTACTEGDIECEERMYQLEETLFAYEAMVTKRLHADAQSCWKADVDAFRSTVDVCDNLACKEAALLERISSLHDLQPATQRASLKLPQAPSLIAVLPPNLEPNPPTANADTSLVVQGTLVHATVDPEHMGIAVHADGKDHVFIFEMDMSSDQGQDEVSGLVGTSPTTHVRVRGIAQVAPTGVSNFDPAQCRWVYQLSNLEAR